MSSVHCCELYFFFCCTALKMWEIYLFYFKLSLDYYYLVLCLSYFPHLLFYIFVFVFLSWLFWCNFLVRKHLRLHFLYEGCYSNQVHYYYYFHYSTGDSGHSHQPSHQWPTPIFCDNSNSYQAGKSMSNEADKRGNFTVNLSPCPHFLILFPRTLRVLSPPM